MKAVVLAGGRGRRMLPYTSVLPKPLMPLGDRSVLEILIEQLYRSGFTDITLSVGYLSHLIRAVLEGGGRTPPVNIEFVQEEEALGTAGPLLVYWMLLAPLRHFLAAIFGDRKIEAFWLRLIVLVLLLAALSAAVKYRPDSAVLSDSVALIFSMADSVQDIFQVLLYTLISLFLPLLATYAVLHATGARAPPRN